MAKREKYRFVSLDKLSQKQKAYTHNIMDARFVESRKTTTGRAFGKVLYFEAAVQLIHEYRRPERLLFRSYIRLYYTVKTCVYKSSALIYKREKLLRGKKKNNAKSSRKLFSVQ